MIKGKQKIIRTACPLFVGVWMLGITFFRDFFRMQEFVYENGRKASVIQYIGLYFSSGWKIQCKLPPKTKRFCPLVLK